ncbi:A disintegrin and metalloproteinase with thrombospondin motifs 1-like isoform X1 [Diadema setosum]|uniref:A disintegrin and metalloproteinase with thrombospondin motifs 1-like isoform X1 n=1 Tax=Diadema setosum TaxID=31175 RepID=UPI003B3B39D8
MQGQTQCHGEYRDTNDNVVRLMPLAMMMTMVVACFNSIAIAEVLKPLRLSNEEVHVYTSGRDIVDHDITSPEYLDASVMTKRSVDSPLVVDGDLLVKFRAFGEDYLVHLHPNYYLMRPDLVIETLGEDGVITEEGSPNRDCHYFARLLSHGDESEGALSTCNGLRGVITHRDTEIYVEPLKDDHESRLRRDVGISTQERAHIVYKRSATSPWSSESPSYGSSSSYEDEDEYGKFEEDQYEADVGRDNQTEPEKFCSPATPPGYNPYQPRQKSPPFTVNPNLGKADVSNDEEQETEDLADEQPRFEDFLETVVGQRYIEIFVLIDAKMVRFHGDDALNYTMSLMNIVSRRYAQGSVGAQIRLVIVRVLVLTTNTPWMIGHDGKNRTMVVSGNGDEVMDELCGWQYHFNPVSDDDPGHWDTAILITRLDLYTMASNNRKSYSLLGRAFVGTICDPEWSCSVNQDDGLPAGFVITHELGHSLSLSHDPTYGCQNNRNIMSSMRPSGIHSLQWSRCSREYLAEFLESDASRCLLDEPATDDENVQLLTWDHLPGVRYDRLEQCNKAYRHHHRMTQFCWANRPSTCGHIGCKVWSSCGWIKVMEGTPCGINRWCYNGHCKSSIGGVPAPIDGGWSEWEGSFTTCSKTCGTGVLYKRRYCNRPGPHHGGKGCVGRSAIMRLCNTEPCPGIITSDDFRREECTATNPVRFRNRLFTWEPNYEGRIDGNELCTLACKTTNGEYYANRDPNKFVDGLQCWKYDTDPLELRRTRHCVDRQCVEFGCDGIFGSGKIKDVCGICEGTGRTCTHVSGSLNEALPRCREWYKLFIVPRGAVGINITNTNNRYCTLALYYGGVNIFEPKTMDRVEDRRYTVEDALIVHYADMYDWEKIWVMSGPTVKKVKVMGKMDWPAWFGSSRYPKFTWEWYEPTTLPVYYYWRQTILTECPVTCGGGNTTADIFCVEEVGGVPMDVSHRLCDAETKPAEYPPCNTQFCPGLMWLIGEWSECSATCDTGQRSRSVDCIEGSTMQPAPTIDCIAHCCFRPNITKGCEEDPCPTTTLPTTTLPTTTLPPTTSPTTLEITTQGGATANLESLPDPTELGDWGADGTSEGMQGNIGTATNEPWVTPSTAENPVSSIPRGHANGTHPRLRDLAFQLFLCAFMHSLK